MYETTNMLPLWLCPGKVCQKYIHTYIKSEVRPMLLCKRADCRHNWSDDKLCTLLTIQLEDKIQRQLLWVRNVVVFRTISNKLNTKVSEFTWQETTYVVRRWRRNARRHWLTMPKQKGIKPDNDLEDQEQINMWPHSKEQAFCKDTHR